MGRQATNLGVEILDLLFVGAAKRAYGVTFLEQTRSAVQGSRAPLAQHVRMHAMFGGELADRLGFLQQFLDEPSCEGRSVRCFHIGSLPYPGDFRVQFSGSSI